MPIRAACFNNNARCNESIGCDELVVKAVRHRLSADRASPCIEARLAQTNRCDLRAVIPLKPNDRRFVRVRQLIVP